MLGNQAAKSGEIDPVCANVLVMVKKMMNTNAIKNPKAI
jgi:hypothetical protein